MPGMRGSAAMAKFTAAERAEINRQNAQKCTGARTPEGKERGRFNALKHGMDALTPVLPGEDSLAFQQRIDAWKADLHVETEVEAALAERAARISWQLDRLDLAEAAAVVHNMNKVL